MDEIALWADDYTESPELYIDVEKYPLRSDIGKRLFEVFDKNGYDVVGLVVKDDWCITVYANKRKEDD